MLVVLLSLVPVLLAQRLIADVERAPGGAAAELPAP